MAEGNRIEHVTARWRAPGFPIPGPRSPRPAVRWTRLRCAGMQSHSRWRQAVSLAAQNAGDVNGMLFGFEPCAVPDDPAQNFNLGLAPCAWGPASHVRVAASFTAEHRHAPEELAPRNATRH